MASFSFAAGNARKLLRMPLYGLARLVTLTLTRGDSWVFGCGAGIGDGALALWQVARTQDPQRAAVWLVDTDRDERDARVLGIPTLRKHSVRGFLATARAGVVVVTHGFGDVNRYALGGAFVVQLWHGIPLKRIGLDSAETSRTRSRVLSRLVATLYRRAARRIAIIPAASQLVRSRLETAFGLPDARVVVTGEPRVDVLSRGTADDRREAGRAGMRRALGAIDGIGTAVLYAPTWRDGAADPSVPDAATWRVIVDRLTALDATLFVRSHPLGAGDWLPPFPTSRVRLLGSDVVRDITPLLPGMDVLVTDYSSLAFDAGLVPLPVLWFAPDAAEYAARRGFYGRLTDVAGEAVAGSWSELLEAITMTVTNAEHRADLLRRSTALSERFHDFRDGRNTERVYGEIIRRRIGRRTAS